MWPGDGCPVFGGWGHLCKQTWPGVGCPIGQASLPSQGQILGWFHLWASPSHFPVSHHPSHEERACNYPFNTWVPDSELISEPVLHLTGPPPALLSGVIHSAALQSSLFVALVFLVLPFRFVSLKPLTLSSNFFFLQKNNNNKNPEYIGTVQRRVKKQRHGVAGRAKDRGTPEDMSQRNHRT